VTSISNAAARAAASFPIRAATCVPNLLAIAPDGFELQVGGRYVVPHGLEQLCELGHQQWGDRGPCHQDALFAALIHLGEPEDELVEAEMDVKAIRPHRGLMLGRGAIG
jgi:hypothetical protein